MITLPREHLLCPFRQHSSRGDTGGDGDIATLKPPDQCPLPCPLHGVPMEILASQRASSRARAETVPEKTSQGLRYKGTGIERETLPRSYLCHLR